MACHGRAWAFATTYDMAFLHLLIGALEGGAVVRRPCTALPYVEVNVRTLSEQSEAWLRAINVLLLRAKCEDDVQDESSLKAKLGLRVSRHLEAPSLQALERSGFSWTVLSTFKIRQAEVERVDSCSLERYGLPTAEVTGEIFAHPAKLIGRPELTGLLRHLGQALGYLIYWRDAFDDRTADSRARRFNALAAASAQSCLADSVEREQRRVEWALTCLPLKEADREALLSCVEQLHPAPPLSKPLLRPRDRRRQAGICDAVIGECLVQLCCQCCGEACLGGAGGCAGECCCTSKETSKGREVNFLDSPSESLGLPKLLCPACSNNLVQKLYASVDVDECPACRGMWLDQGELEKLLDHRNMLPDRFFEPVKVEPLKTRPEGTRPCPRCGLLLLSNLVSGVTIDICTDCSGLWLDQGELNLFLEQ